MPNRRRGEVALELGGQSYLLCPTLGALADLLVVTFGAAPPNPPPPQDV